MEKYVNLLYELALKSYNQDDVPVGCIILKDNKLLASGYNTRHSLSIVTGHAEINAINEASKKLGDWRTNECIMITTLKPCKMCYEVIEASRIQKVYYLLDQENGTEYPEDKYVKLSLENNLIVQKYKQLLKNFFKKMR